MKTVSTKIEPSTIHPLPHNDPIASGGFPQILAFVVLRMHGRLGLEEPLDDPIVAVLGCKVQRCFASGAAAQGQPRRQNRNERKWKNTLRKFWRLKSQSFGNVSTLKIPLDLRNIKVLRCLEAIELLKKMKKPCQPRRQPGCACMLNVEISSQGNFLECWMNVEISRHIYKRTWPTGSVWKDEYNCQAGILYQEFSQDGLEWLG